MASTKRNLQIWVDPDIYGALEHFSQRVGMSKSALVSQLLEAALGAVDATPAPPPPNPTTDAIRRGRKVNALPA